MKTALKFILILAVTAFLVASMMGTMGKSTEILCTDIELEVEDSLEVPLLDKADLEKLLKKSKITYKNKKIKDINLGLLESTLSQSPYVDTAHTKFNASGKLLVTIVPRKPALHVMAKNGEEYLLDLNGATLPVGNTKGNLLIVTGNVDKKFAKTQLIKLGKCIQDSAFWKVQAQQIDVVNENDIRLYTRVADHVIRLGNMDSIGDKLHRLQVFYQQGLPQTGWNKYESLNVEFQGLVIGTKKKVKKTDY